MIFLLLYLTSLPCIDFAMTDLNDLALILFKFPLDMLSMHGPHRIQDAIEKAMRI